jgi:hypothetical protein
MSSRGAGESRAAKRRKKEKNKTGSSAIDAFESMDADANIEHHSDFTAGFSSSTFSEANHLKPSMSFNELLLASDDYVATSKSLFEHLIFPVTSDEFYSKICNSLPYHFNHADSNYFKGLPTKKGIQQCLKEHAIEYDNDVKLSKNSDPLGYDPNSIITDTQIWKYFSDGYVVDICKPIKYFDKIWHYVSLLEIEFESSLECDIIIAPSGSQFFLTEPVEHEIFLIQTFGSSSWKILPPAHLVSNPTSGRSNKCIECILMQGDALYVPPQWQLTSSAIIGDLSTVHSFRIIQKKTILNISEMIMNQCALNLSNQNNSFNQLLPRHLFSFMGVAHSEEDEPRRDALTNSVKLCLNKISRDAVEMLDAAADQLAKQFVCSRVPVPLTEEEEKLSFSGGGRDIRLFPHSKLRMIRPGIAIALVEDGHVVVYHCSENSR